MPDTFSQILPTLNSLGLWSYWIIGLFSMLESWWVTGVIAPGTLVVEAGGVLVRVGHLAFLDLVWFVAVGAILGGELSWHTGRWLGGRLGTPRGRSLQRAQELVRRHGPLALVIGRLLGPLAALAALAAALSGMERRRFVIWNIVGGVVYAVVQVSLGYLAASLLSRLSAYMPELLLPLAALAVLTLVVWLVVRQLRRAAPAWREAVATLGSELGAGLAARPLVRGLVRRCPAGTGWLARRADARRRDGLALTGTVAGLLLLAGLLAWLALAVRMAGGPLPIDLEAARIAHAAWTPRWLTAARWSTELGQAPVAGLLALGAVIGFLGAGRRGAALGLAVAALGNALSVTAMKLLLGRPRPDLSYFAEPTASFPSGHAALSVAIFATLALLAWRERLIGAVPALVAAIALAGGLGLTRLYLAVHYLTDVMAGWLLGAIWMGIGLALAGALRRHDRPARRPMRRLGLAGLAACALAALWLALTQERIALHPLPEGAKPGVMAPQR